MRVDSVSGVLSVDSVVPWALELLKYVLVNDVLGVLSADSVDSVMVVLLK